jgi:hypothetical protein
MPQLDFLIMTSQTIFLFIFLFGYVFFIKNILPMISFEIKLRELLEFSYLKWFDANQNKFIVMDKVLLSSLKSINSIFDFVNYSMTSRNLLYGYSYSYDLISLRSAYRSKYEDRLF